MQHYFLTPNVTNRKVSLKNIKVFCNITDIEIKEKERKMVDFNSNISEPHGMPKLDKDYWQSQKKVEQVEPNLFDNLIKTNFDVENLKGISVFKSKEK